MDEIANNLRSLKMPGMANFWTSLHETRQHDDLSLKDGLLMMIQAELDNRTMSRNAKLLKKAHFRYQASIDQVIFDSSRGVDKQKVLNLASCDYIKYGTPIIMTGAAGTGKSWLASALGHQACMNGYKVVYFNLYRLFEEIALARVSGTLHRFFTKLAQTDLLIIDDFGIKVLDGQQLLDFMEIIEDRHGQKSTIIVSQLPVSNWYDVLKKNTTAADAILDRIVHTAVRFDLYVLTSKERVCGRKNRQKRVMLQKND